MRRIITFTSDFGLKDHYHGAVKGVILSINPEALIVDISHLVSPGDIVEGALILEGAFSWFPAGTIHLAVVDPGVGGTRRAVAIETEHYVFVGPDNGLLSLAAKMDGVKRVVELKERRYFLPEVSNTFHGRDIFGPIAAHLSLGVDAGALGDIIRGAGVIELPGPVIKEGLVKGAVIYIDSFGNLITNIEGRDVLGLTGGGSIEAAIKGVRIRGLRETYSSGRKKELMALIGSSGRLEIACNCGSAEKRLRARRGEAVTVKAVKVK